MLFLAWLAVSFLAVVIINLYLRYFGLPRRPLTSAVDGRAYFDRSAAGNVGVSAAGYMAPGAGALGGSGGGWTTTLFGAGHGSASAETVSTYVPKFRITNNANNNTTRREQRTLHIKFVSLL